MAEEPPCAIRTVRDAVRISVKQHWLCRDVTFLVVLMPGAITSRSRVLAHPGLMLRGNFDLHALRERPPEKRANRP